MEYGCIGEKLAHSFSKIIHNELCDYEYELMEIPKDELSDFLTKKDFKAINVTIPYKQEVIPYLNEIDDVAKEIGAVNTVVNKNGRLLGFNTDFSGMTALINKNGIDVKDKKVLILGSGGTSKTAYAVVRALKAKSVYRVSRAGKDGCITYKNAYSNHSDAEIIINTTPCGMYPSIGEAAIDISIFENLSGVVDAVYNPLKSALIVEAEKRGIKACGGLYMLVYQAAAAAEHFIGEKISVSKIDKVYERLLKDKQNLVLIGMPGCGKSTIGKKLAALLNKEFIDTDSLIVDKAGCPIPQIFKQQGEKKFRDIESLVLKEASALQGKIIATGGGAVLRKENVDILKENGIIVFIDRPLEFLVTTDDRPLSNNREKLERLFNERYSIYCDSADITVKAVQKIEQNVEVIKEEFLA